MTSPDRKTWEGMKEQYLREVSKALSSIRHPHIRQMLGDVSSHLDRRFEELPLDGRTPENLQAIIADMGPASDYAELLEPQAGHRRRKPALRSVVAVGAVALALTLVVVVGAWAVVLHSTQGRPVTIVQPPEYRVDCTFEDDPAVVGAWRSIGLVDSIEGFIPGRDTAHGELWLHHLVFESGGRIAGGLFTWTKGLVICDHEKTAFRYEIRRVKDADYLFFEWIGDEARSGRGVIPRYYVMERTTPEAVRNQAMMGQTAELPATSTVDDRGRIVDRIDYPFVNDPNSLGYWQSVDFVSDPCDFTPGKKRFRGDLFLKELFVLPGGRTNWAFTWTSGLILHQGDQTASRYVLRQRDSQTYMFLEWKSGDYVYRHQRPGMYVLMKGPDRPYVEARVADRIDYPFVDDPNVIGTWKTVGLVDKPEDFRAGRRKWQGRDLWLRDLVFLPSGKTPQPWLTWTKGLVIHRGDQTASAYLIERIDGATYMFLECKNGDYVRWRMDPKYFVLRKE
jgi:hypothetical protein